MSRNSEYRFGAIPQTKIGRSIFKMRKNVKGSFNVGDIIPFYVNQDILPGDTFKIKQSIVIRLATPIYPTMDNLVLDTYFFSEGWNILWEDFKKFMGENESGAWAISPTYEIPQLTVPSNATGTGIPGKGSIWDYMGLPIGIKGSDAQHPISVSNLPFRMYADVYNYFFRNQNLIAPTALAKDSTTRTFVDTYVHRGGKPLKASKLPSYLSTCLPAPQKGAPVAIPLGTTAPVTIQANNEMAFKRKVNDETGNLLVETTGDVGLGGTNAGTQSELFYANGLKGYADLSNATAATINALRLAFQTQKILEADARGGTRYFDEILQTHFATTSGAGRYLKPCYLGGKRIPLTMNQVAQTSESSNTSPMGNVGAFSLTADIDHIFTQSFTEHSIIMGLMVVRQLNHVSQQNIPRQWSRRQRLDLYWPELAHLGEQPVLNKEIYADGSSTDNEVFGYQERWAEYKYEENVVCGELRSTYSTPLDTWHYGDKYNSLPVLNQSWIEETPNNVTRTLAVQNHDQLIFDTDLYITAIRPIPTYCTPGLIDHF